MQHIGLFAEMLRCSCGGPGRFRQPFGPGQITAAECSQGVPVEALGPRYHLSDLRTVFGGQRPVCQAFLGARKYAGNVVERRGLFCLLLGIMFPFGGR